jgi:leader peptidase (prepilin peptidase)/N-methyltransferase
MAWALGYVAVMGLLVGSFLNVVVYRVPRGLSVVRPRSACPQCATPISGRDNIPVLSWLLLRGKCRHCHHPISVRYPLVEVTNAVLWVVGALRIGFHPVLGAVLVATSILFALALIDAETMTLPRTLVYWGLGLVALGLVGASLYSGETRPLVLALVFGASWFLVFFLMNFASPRALGFGDVRLGGLLGLILGWWGLGEVLVGFFASNVLGVLVGGTLILTKRHRRDQPIPYGVYLASGTLFALWFAPALLRHWHHWPQG